MLAQARNRRRDMRLGVLLNRLNGRIAFPQTRTTNYPQSRTLDRRHPVGQDSVDKVGQPGYAPARRHRQDVNPSGVSAYVTAPHVRCRSIYSISKVA